MAQDEIRVTLNDHDIVEFARAKVRSGEYASEADVVKQGLDALKHEAEQRERWEREVLLPAHDRYIKNPESGLSAEQVRQALEVKRRERLKAS